MRSRFKGHFAEPQEEITRLWKTATFVFDANVLLNLYRYSDTARDEFVKLLKNIQDRCWLPEQCVHEFFANRHSVIGAQIKAYADTEKNISAIQDNFAGPNSHPFLSAKNFDALSTVIESIKEELTKSRELQEARITNDEIREAIADIFEEKVGPEYSDEAMDALFLEGEKRFSEEIPPGYKDKNKFQNAIKRSEKRANLGDFLLWRQILDLAKDQSKDVIFVTDDQKEDWWLTISGKTISARPELLAEFHEYSGNKILIYSTGSFLKQTDEKLGQAVSGNTIEEIRQEHFSRYKDLDKSIEDKFERASRMQNSFRQELGRVARLKAEGEGTRFTKLMDLIQPIVSNHSLMFHSAEDKEEAISRLKVLQLKLEDISSRTEDIERMIERSREMGEDKMGKMLTQERENLRSMAASTMQEIVEVVAETTQEE